LSSFVHQIAPFLEDAKSDRGFCSSEILGQVQSWASIRIDSRTTAGAIDPRDVQRKRIGAGARMISAKALTKTLESLWASGQPGISRYPLAGYGAGNRVWWKLDPVELGKTDMPEDGK
jgi:hypothetical protein